MGEKMWEKGGFWLNPWRRKSDAKNAKKKKKYHQINILDCGLSSHMNGFTIKIYNDI